MLRYILLSLILLTSPAAADWIIKTETDPMDDRRSITIVLPGTNGKLFFVMCKETLQGPWGVLSGFSDNSHFSSDKITVKYRINKGPTEEIIVNSTNDLLTITSNDVADLFQKIRESKTFAISYQDSEDNRHVSEFFPEADIDTQIKVLQAWMKCIGDQP